MTENEFGTLWMRDSSEPTTRRRVTVCIEKRDRVEATASVCVAVNQRRDQTEVLLGHALAPLFDRQLRYVIEMGIEPN